LQLRTSVPPENLINAVEAQVQELDPNMPVFDVMTMDRSLMGANGFFLYKMGAAFAGTLGALGLLLAVVGVYGVVSYNAARRTHEIGVRMALGAKPANVFRLVLSQAALLVGAGIAIGLLAALAVTKLLASLLVGVASYDPLTFATVAALLILSAFIACYIPAHRAMRVAPWKPSATSNQREPGDTGVHKDTRRRDKTRRARRGLSHDDDGGPTSVVPQNCV
jgi:ABC-type antimicrobial peptide transport system permease subunit